MPNSAPTAPALMVQGRLVIFALWPWIGPATPKQAAAMGWAAAGMNPAAYRNSPTMPLKSIMRRAVETPLIDRAVRVAQHFHQLQQGFGAADIAGQD